jgi:hypothetical protein
MKRSLVVDPEPGAGAAAGRDGPGLVAGAGGGAVAEHATAIPSALAMVILLACFICQLLDKGLVRASLGPR